MLFKNKSFVVKMVPNEDVDQTETVAIDVEKTVDTIVKAGLILMGAYFVGSTARQLIVGHSAGMSPVFNNTVAPVISPIMNNTVEHAGHLTKIVKRAEDNKIWEQVNDAAFDLAAEQGITFDRARWLISRTINGHKPDYFNLNYATIGAGSTG